MSKYSIVVETVWTLANIAFFIFNHYLGKVQDEYIKELEHQNKSLIRYAKWLTEGIRGEGGQGRRKEMPSDD